MDRKTLVASLLAAALPALPRAQARAQTVPTLRVATPAVEDAAPLLYAVSAHLFEKAGLNVVLTNMSSGAAISAAVAGGAEDVGLSSLQGLISGYVHGLGFQLVAPGGVYNATDPYAYLLVRADSGIRSAKDLEGKTLAAPALKDLDWIASYAWLQQNGANVDTLKFVELPSPALVPALSDGRIDALTVGEPWVQRALDSGKARILAKSFSAIAPRFLMTGWFTTKDIAAKESDALVKFERVMRDASLYTDAHHAEIVPILAAYAKLDADLVARTIKDNGAPYLDPRLIQPMIDVSARYQLIPKAFPAQVLISDVALKPGR